MINRCFILAVTFLIVSASAQALPIGLRGGAGTDVTGGIAYGAGLNYFIPFFKGGLEPGLQFYGGRYSESSNNGFNDYNEETTLLAFVALANYLYGYELEDTGLFGVLGVGFAALNIDWTESSPTDTSLGTPLPGGGSQQSEDGTLGGSVLNIGVGYKIWRGLDVRFEVPVIIAFAPPGGASAVIPTFVLTAGWRL